MKNDCCIENWIRKNTPLLCFIFKLISFWIVLIILIMVVKYCYFGLSIKNYDLARISLNNVLTLGAAISAAAFAWRQIEINQHTAEVELAIRYKDHYVKLVKALRNFINCHKLSENTSLKIRESAWIELIDIALEGQLIFNTDIQKFNKEIQLNAYKVFQNKEKMNAKKFHCKICNKRNKLTRSIGLLIIGLLEKMIKNQCAIKQQNYTRRIQQFSPIAN